MISSKLQPLKIAIDAPSPQYINNVMPESLNLNRIRRLQTLQIVSYVQGTSPIIRFSLGRQLKIIYILFKFYLVLIKFIQPLAQAKSISKNTI